MAAVSTELTAAELAEIETRAEAATTGPWVHDADKGGEHRVGTSDGKEWVAYIGNDEDWPHPVPDAAFIAAARTDVPRLVAALRAAYAELETSRRIRESWRTDYEKLRAEALRGADREAERGHAIVGLREQVRIATDRGDLLRNALEDAHRNIPGVTDAANRVSRVLAADKAGQLSPRHVDGMGRPQFCDDAEAEVVRLRNENAEALATLTELAPHSLGAQLEEARMWARHGYEIGQRSCLWADQGVAPAWLTEGWPTHFEADPLLQENLKLERDLADLRAELARAQRATAALRKLHWEHEGRCVNCITWCDCDSDIVNRHQHNVPWPCSTAKALAAEVPAAAKPRCTAVNPATGNMCESVPHWSYYPHWFGLTEQWSDAPADACACPPCGTWEMRGDVHPRCPECGNPWAVRPDIPAASEAAEVKPT